MKRTAGAADPLFATDDRALPGCATGPVVAAAAPQRASYMPAVAQASVRRSARDRPRLRIPFVPEKILELPGSLWAHFMAAVKRDFVGLSSSIVLGVIAHNVVNISRAIQKRAARVDETKRDREGKRFTLRHEVIALIGTVATGSVAAVFLLPGDRTQPIVDGPTSFREPQVSTIANPRHPQHSIIEESPDRLENSAPPQ
jgi:hypothetical protein